MIEISSNTAIMIYLGVSIFSILAVWGWHHWSGKKKKIQLGEKKLVLCEFCHFAYLDNGIKKVTRCPQCQSYNG